MLKIHSKTLLTTKKEIAGIGFRLSQKTVVNPKKTHVRYQFVALKKDARKGHFGNGCAQGSFGNGYAQKNGLF